MKRFQEISLQSLCTISITFFIVIAMNPISIATEVEEESTDSFIIKQGYSSSAMANNAAGGFDYLPNGDVLSIDFSSPQNIVLLDANGDGNPASPQVVGTLPAGTFGSFLKVSPNGAFALYGATGATNPINKINFSNYSVTPIVDLPGNYSLAFRDNSHVFVSANTTFNPSDPNQIFFMDLNNPAGRQLIAELFNTPSGPLAINDVGDLYYVKSTWIFPPPANSHHLLKFTSGQIQAAMDNDTILNEADSQIDVTLDGGFNVELNAFGDIFVSSLTGETYKVDEKNGVASVFFSTNNPPNDGSFTHLAFHETHQFFNPHETSDSKLGVAFANNTFTDFSIVQISPAVDDSFADNVLNFLPGQGGTGNTQLVLGPPVGGGTAIPNSSSIIQLGDRDNPNSSAPALVEIGFNKAIGDDGQNLHGLDFIVFSNSFWNGGNEQNRFSEPALIEVSQDFNHNDIADDQWFLIKPNILPADLGPTNPVTYSTMTLRNYGEYSPTLRLGDTNGDNVVENPGMDPEDFYTVPDRLSFAGDPSSYLIDANSGGGDASDLRDAIAQTSPGVPLVDGFGQNHYVYLDRVDFIRLRDVRNNDVHPGPLGLVTAEIDAVADAKSHLRGTTVTVNNIAQLQLVLQSAAQGDEIILNPGIYNLNSTLNIPPGVSLRGSAGLWTVNFPNDDVVIKGDNLLAGQAAVRSSDPTGTYTYEQGYEISGLHFVNCPIGISVEGLTPTIEENFFTDVGKAIELDNRPGEGVVIRYNVFGHKVLANSSIGIEAQDIHVAINHNTFVNHTNTALLLNSGTKAYVRDNIFAENETGIEAGNSDYIHANFNLFDQNNSNYNFTTGLIENDILRSPSFALAAMGDYRLANDSSARETGMGRSDPGAYDGPNFYPLDIATGYYLNLNQFPWFESLNNGSDPIEKYSGAAVAKMWLTYLWWNENDSPDGPLELDPPLHDQQYLFDYGHAQNHSVNAGLDRLDAKGLHYAVQTNDPPFNPYHYNFGIYKRSDQQQALNDICHWIAYPAGGGNENPNGHGVDGHPVHVPAAVPTGGNYDNWMAVRGIRTTENPFEKNRYGIFGFWINDPNPSGIGENSYKTVEQFTSNYFLPLTDVDPADPYFNQWVSILEPPEDESAAVAIEGKKRLKKEIENFLQLETILIDGTDKHVYVQDHLDEEAFDIIRAAIEGLKEELLDFDQNLSKIFKNTIARKPLFVNDPKGDYYIVAFEQPIENATPQRRSIMRTRTQAGKIKETQPVNKEKPSQWSRFQIADGNKIKVAEMHKDHGVEIRPGDGLRRLRKNRTLVVAIVDAKDGRFKEASWVEEPVEYLKVSRSQAMRILSRGLFPKKMDELRQNISKYQRRVWRWAKVLYGKSVRQRLLQGAEIDLVRSKASPYHPDWRICYEGTTYLIDQKGNISIGDQ